MKIFLKILGIVFALLVTIVLGMGVFIIVGDCSINKCMWLLSEGEFEVYVTLTFCMAISILFAFCPIVFEINRAIEDKFY